MPGAKKSVLAEVDVPYPVGIELLEKVSGPVTLRVELLEPTFQGATANVAERLATQFTPLPVGAVSLSSETVTIPAGGRRASVTITPRALSAGRNIAILVYIPANATEPERIGGLASFVVRDDRPAGEPVQLAAHASTHGTSARGGTPRVRSPIGVGKK